MKNQRNYCPYCMTPISGNASCPNCGLTAGTYVPSPHHLRPGTVLMDRYLVGRVLGEGGFGITYIGCDLRLELKVAIKEYYPVDKASRNATISPELTGYSVGPAREGFERGKKKFLNEARAMAKMDKQQVIVSVRDFFEANNTAYIVMEYIEGTTFTELVAQRGGRLSPQELFPMIEPLFRALSTLHEGGLIHRDISPDNLMLENGEVRLIDFGCARESEHGEETLTITLKHGYAPIEQYQQKGQGPWTDVYALCATIYFCLVGKKPPQALDRIGGESDLMLPSKLGIAITPQQEAAILRGLNLSPRGRFQTMEELHGALYPAVVPDPVPPDPVPPEPVPPEPVPPEPVPPEPVPPEPVPPDPVADITSDIPTPSRFRQYLAGKGRYVALGGVFVLAAAICLAGLLLGGGAPEQAPVEPVEPVEEVAAQPSQIDPAAVDWENAHILTSLDMSADGFQRLMGNPSITALVAPAGLEGTLPCQKDGSPVSLTKPLRIDQGATLRIQALIVEEGGFLEVYGTLDARYSQLQLRGQDTRLFFPNGAAGCFQAANCSLWMETSPNMSAADLTFAREAGAYVVIFQEDLDGAQEVSTLEELKAAQDCRLLSGIKITRDIVLDEGLSFSCPVYICEGVTLSAAPQEPGADLYQPLSMYSSRAVLVNYGDLSVPFLWMGAGASALNFGTIDSSLWMDWEGNACVFWNAGQAALDGLSRVWKGMFLNACTGALETPDMYIVSGSALVNLGQILVQPVSPELGGEELYLQTGAILYNYGSITVAENAALVNCGILRNQGELDVQEKGILRNSFLVENQGGTIKAAQSAELSGIGNQVQGVYCSTGGAIDLQCGDLPTIYPILSDEEMEQLSAAPKADTAEELAALLADPQVEAIAISSDFAYSGHLTLTKDLYLTGKLSLGEGHLTAIGCKLILAEGGALEAQDLSLLERTVVQLEGGTLSLPDGGGLLLDQSLLLDNGGQLYAPGADIQLRQEAAIGVRDSGNFLFADGSAFRLEGRSACLLGHLGALALTDVSLEADSSLIALNNYAIFRNSSITLENQGQLVGSGATMNMDACSLTVAQNADANLRECNLVFANTVLRNDGNLFFNGWDEYSVQLKDSQIYNNQSFFLFLPMTFAGDETAIYNRGELYTNRALPSDRVIGNAPRQE